MHDNQEVWLRWQTADRSSALEPSAFLATITTRLAINFSQSARSRRESHVLGEAFDYSYEKVAEILRSTEANMRQLVSRALTAVARLSSDVAAGLKIEPSSPLATGFPPRPA
jgi:RNA polymerase sigma-70 factor (ECF subfamily)